tara:strand:+ start:198 stop:461 length:264 start_codon:yes stop_codon:yes gene_type:complete
MIETKVTPGNEKDVRTFLDLNLPCILEDASDDSIYLFPEIEDGQTVGICLLGGYSGDIAGMKLTMVSNDKVGKWREYKGSITIKNKK